MAFRDDFYRASHIIGYTGQLHADPTVYFRDGQTFGHITQAHDIPENVGRGAVGTHPAYSIRNELVDGTRRCVERRGDHVFHTSRNVFIEAATLGIAEIAILARAIARFPDEKQWVHMTRDEKQAAIRRHRDALDLAARTQKLEDAT